MASVIEELEFKFYDFNFIVNSFEWIVTTVLDGIVLEPQSGTKFRKSFSSHDVKFSFMLAFLPSDLQIHTRQSLETGMV